MNSFLFALQFLTIIPLKIKQVSHKATANALIFFPLAGLLLGVILCGANYILGLIIPQQIFVNVILIILLVFLSGGIHLDGLADTIDALLSNKGKEEMLSIMRDSHIGAMGALSLICVILLKISLLSSISWAHLATALILICLFSRWSLVLAMLLFPYARAEGKAKIFLQEINLKIFILATAIALFCSILISGLIGVFCMLIISLVVFLLGKFISKKFGGITGDSLGAMNEAIELSTLLLLIIAERGGWWIT